MDYEAIQPWPTKRPHIVKIDGRPRNHDHLAGWEEPSSIDPLIPDDEPVFVLRAVDAVGPATVRTWADLAEKAGTDPLVVNRVREWADEMEAYGAAHLAHVPDTPVDLLRGL